MRVQIDSERCQGHGRCYDLAPKLFAADDEGYGQVIGGGALPDDERAAARLAESNCPEAAVAVLQEAPR